MMGGPHPSAAGGGRTRGELAAALLGCGGLLRAERRKWRVEGEGEGFFFFFLRDQSIEFKKNEFEFKQS
jgi:hypothetical protein